MKPDSLEETITKLRERVAFLERANQSVSADRKRIMDEFARCETILGSLGGLSLSGALAARLAKESRAEARIERRVERGRSARMDVLAQSYPRDTGFLSDELMDELLST